MEHLRASDGERDFGWGTPLDQILGGGFEAGQLVLLGAKSAGSGKTQFMMQGLLGLGLCTQDGIDRGLNDHPLTPVLLVSEMKPRDLARRAVARWIGADARILRSGIAAERYHSKLSVDSIFDQATAALEGLLGRALWHICPLDDPGRGDALVTQICSEVGRLREHYERQYRRHILPVVLIDPLQRYLSTETNDVEAQNDLANALRQMAQREELLIFMTSDSNKGAAAAWSNSAREVDEYAAGAFRGSYVLLHQVDVALFLFHPSPGDRSAGELVDSLVFLQVVKNRWGPQVPRWDAIAAYYWTPGEGLFTPLTGSALEEALEGLEKTRGGSTERGPRGAGTAKKGQKAADLLNQAEREILAR